MQMGIPGRFWLAGHVPRQHPGCGAAFLEQAVGGRPGFLTEGESDSFLKGEKCFHLQLSHRIIKALGTLSRRGLCKASLEPRRGRTKQGPWDLSEIAFWLPLLILLSSASVFNGKFWRTRP